MSDDSKPAASADGGTPRRDVLIALIEHGSRPLAYTLIGLFVVVWLFSVREPLFRFVQTVEKLDVFGVVLEVKARNRNLDTELAGLQGLNDDQLNLFLVVGRKRERINYKGPEATEDNLDRLKGVGLLSEVTVIPGDPEKPKSEEELSWRVSDQGHELHQIIFEEIKTGIRFSQKTK